MKKAKIKRYEELEGALKVFVEAEGKELEFTFPLDIEDEEVIKILKKTLKTKNLKKSRSLPEEFTY